MILKHNLCSPSYVAISSHQSFVGPIVAEPPENKLARVRYSSLLATLINVALQRQFFE